MRTRQLSSVVAVLAVLALGGCGGDDSGTSAGDNASTPATDQAATTPSNTRAPSGEPVRSAKVEISDFKFTPAKVTIQAGGKITWLNDGPSAHTATLDDGSFDSGTLQEGKLKSQSFKQAGTFTYHCSIHPQMTGAVEVVPSR